MFKHSTRPVESDASSKLRLDWQFHLNVHPEQLSRAPLYNCHSFLLQIKDVTRNIKKALCATTLEEVKEKSAEKFGKTDMPAIHLDSDGTEIDDEDYFQTLEPNAELIAVFPGEQWIDVSGQFFFFVCGALFVLNWQSCVASIQVVTPAIFQIHSKL